MSPLQASVVNTRLVDSDRDRKGTLNSCQCFAVSGTAVELQGRSGQPSRMEQFSGLFGLRAFELGGKYNRKEQEESAQTHSSHNPIKVSDCKTNSSHCFHPPHLSCFISISIETLPRMYTRCWCTFPYECHFLWGFAH